MSWVQALEILNDIVTRMTKRSEGSDWMTRLENADCKDAHRLGLCIAIDVASGALTSDEYAEVLDCVDHSEICSRRALAKAASIAKSSAAKGASRLAIPSPGADRYLRVLSVGDFITYYRKDRTLSPDDVAAVHAEHFSAYVSQDLSDIRELWSGPNGVVWVMSYEEFEDLKVVRSLDALATLLNDALGLGREPTVLTQEERDRGAHDVRELVGVLYPLGFDHAKQPTTLDAGWMTFGSYYVSNGEQDGWGRTVSCSGSQKPLRERVHKEFKKPLIGFFGLTIGHITARTINRLTLLEIADRRLESILSTSDS